MIYGLHRKVFVDLSFVQATVTGHGRTGMPGQVLIMVILSICFNPTRYTTQQLDEQTALNGHIGVPRLTLHYRIGGPFIGGENATSRLETQYFITVPLTL